jgi:hypothetical protein
VSRKVLTAIRAGTRASTQLWRTHKSADVAPFSDIRAVLSASSRVVGYSASEVKRAPTRSATIIMPAEPKRRTS